MHVCERTLRMVLNQLYLMKSLTQLFRNSDTITPSSEILI